MPSAAVPTCVSQRGPVNASSSPYQGKDARRYPSTARLPSDLNVLPGTGPTLAPTRPVVSICPAASSICSNRGRG
ncbi:hypothetical protein LUX12_07780 [Streptomyces somaliensis]|uniref:hypothetical protein n=1 Tax=Streptomyces somaliensis TaxID=78355 RepID=UPI0020CC3058|nr:hypothetical protein [Streptomyces somaliensis]MCP9944699.1 hypothetical protein [Streptomyces somaliensis]